MSEHQKHYPSHPVNLWKAWKAFWGLVGDREDTRYVFEFFDNVNGRSYDRFYETMLASEYGQRVIADHEHVGRILKDRETLESYGPGTFAAAYLDYLDSEQLDPEGVHTAHWDNAPEAMQNLKDNYPDVYALTYMMALIHDLYHVLTGYGRDPLGEAVLLVYSAEMSGGRGGRWLGHLAGMKIRSEIPQWPVGRMMREAVRLARKAKDFPTADLPSMLQLPLDEARAQLNIDMPVLYQKTLAEWDGPMPVEPTAEAA